VCPLDEAKPAESGLTGTVSPGEACLRRGGPHRIRGSRTGAV